MEKDRKTVSIDCFEPVVRQDWGAGTLRCVDATPGCNSSVMQTSINDQGFSPSNKTEAVKEQQEHNMGIMYKYSLTCIDLPRCRGYSDKVSANGIAVGNSMC